MDKHTSKFEDENRVFDEEEKKEKRKESRSRVTGQENKRKKGKKKREREGKGERRSRDGRRQGCANNIGIHVDLNFVNFYRCVS